MKEEIEGIKGKEEKEKIEGESNEENVGNRRQF